jgi:hypothetical protein
VGDWPAEWIDEEARERELREMRILRERGWIEDPPSWAEDEVEKARRISQTADPKSVLQAGSRLQEVLQSGRFRVTGQVFFRPLQPFNPSPEIPDENDRFVAMEEIEFNYV